MRTTVIPAQITTVEDKIAGSLSLTQVMLLMIPVIFTTIAYAIFPPRMHIEGYKLVLVFIVLVISLILSLRIKGKVVLNWLVILLRYNTRARYYVFNKNDTYLRDIVLPKTHKKQTMLLEKALSKNEAKLKAKLPHIQDSLRIKNFLKNPNYSLSLKPNKKGGLYVAVNKIEQ
jgi:hypothetical protein